MAFPVVESTAESSVNTAGTSHAVTLPASIAASDLVLITMDIGSTSATLNALTDWGEILDENAANGLKILRYTGAGVPSTPTFTSSASTRSASIAWRISGANKAITPEIGSTATGTSATPDPPASASPGSTKDYLFIAFAGMAGEEADDDTWGNTPPTNYTPNPPLQKSCGTAGTNLGGLILAASRQLNTGSAQDPGSFGVDVSAAWRAQTIMIHPIVDTTVTPTTLAHTLTTFAPTVTKTNNQRVTPTTLALTTATFAPTIRLNKIATPSTKALTLTTFAPSTRLNKIATPTTAALTTSTFAPTVSAPRLVTPSTKALTLTTFAPTVSAPRLVTPSTAALSASSFAPTLIFGTVVTPSTTALIVTTLAPTVSTPRLITPTTASLTVNGFAPTVQTPRLVTPDALGLSLTTYAPALMDSIEIVPQTAALSITKFAPTISTPRSVTPQTLSLSLSTFAPSVLNPRLITPSTLAVTLSAFAPTVSVGSPAITVTPGTLALTLTGYAPSLRFSVIPDEVVSIVISPQNFRAETVLQTHRVVVEAPRRIRRTEL